MSNRFTSFRSRRSKTLFEEEYSCSQLLFLAPPRWPSDHCRCCERLYNRNILPASVLWLIALGMPETAAPSPNQKARPGPILIEACPLQVFEKSQDASKKGTESGYLCVVLHSPAHDRPVCLHGLYLHFLLLKRLPSQGLGSPQNFLRKTPSVRRVLDQDKGI